MSDKAKIIKVGKVENGIASDWEFDGSEAENVAGIAIASDGGKLCAGYTLNELREYSAGTDAEGEDRHE